MNKKILLFGSLLAGGVLAITRLLFAKSALANPTSNNASYDAIDAHSERQMHRLHIPGISLAIIDGDRIVHMRGFGRARPGGEVPAPHTPFFIGSLTKSITALAVMQLGEGGKGGAGSPAPAHPRPVQ